MTSPARVAVLLLAFATIGCDQATKHVARSQLAGKPRQTYLGDTLRLEYVENTGAFLGLGLGGHFKTGHHMGGQNRPPEGGDRDSIVFTS